MLEPGDVLEGDYEIIRRLGGGGMGAVYLAHQRSTDALRAVKVMLPQWTAHESLVQRFEQEARACGRIESDHVVKIVNYGVDHTRRLPWLVMEYLPGETLEERVRRLGPPDPAELLQILEQLFHGLIAAHRAGVVHRDLKPQNIYVANPQRAGVPFTIKILDFGIAKMLTGSRALTQAMGTKAWMAPEQEQSETVITEAADVWAIGLITFWLLTGRAFWLNMAGRESDLSYEVFFGAIPLASLRARQLGSSRPLPSGIDAWLARCLERDPALRFPSAEPCWVHLRQVLNPSLHVSAPLASLSGSTMPVSNQLGEPNAGRHTEKPSAGWTAIGLAPTAQSGPNTTSPTFQTQPAPVKHPAPAGVMWPVAAGIGLLAAVVVGALLLAPTALRQVDSVLGALRGVSDDETIDEVSTDSSAPTTSAELPESRDRARPTPPPSSAHSEMVRVRAGTFLMGFDDGLERHRPHRVSITRDYLIDRLETTVREYAGCVSAGTCAPNAMHGRDLDSTTRERLAAACNALDQAERSDHPINCVDRSQAQTYCASRGKRLPTEAEWEYAARGSDGRSYPWGNAPPHTCEMAVLAGVCKPGSGTAAVGERSLASASPFGALDMSGNVWEWVGDSWSEASYRRDDVADPLESAESARGILRGGSWDFSPGRGIVTYRLPFNHREANASTGFRCAKDLQ